MTASEKSLLRAWGLMMALSIALAIAAEVMRLRPQTQPASLPRRRVTVAPAAQPTESGQET